MQCACRAREEMRACMWDARTVRACVRVIGCEGRLSVVDGGEVMALEDGPGDEAGGPVGEESDGGSDDDGDTVIYSATGLPEGHSIDENSGLISGTVSYTRMLTSTGSAVLVPSVAV